jgi:outer membrane protein TolC
MRFGIVKLLILCLVASSAMAQDSSKIFSQQDLFWYLNNYHPVSKQAAIQVKKGASELKRTRGALDPTLFAGLNQKQFQKKEYYNLFAGGLKVPTWYGVDFRAGYELNQGNNLNPQNENPANGLVFAGVSLPLGQGLFIDKRRATIKQAELYARSTTMEQTLMLNSLFYEASLSYLQWVNYFNQVQLFQYAVDLAKERFRGVKGSYTGGDVPSIDTLEAYILLQVRELNLNQAILDYQKAGFHLSNFLWFEEGIPLEITDKIKPPTIEQLAPLNTITLDSLNSILQNLKNNHPKLVWYDYKLKQLEVERRWNAEQLKPNVNLKYNLLKEPIDGEVVGGFSTNNYTWGFDISFPLFLRESRGKLNITKLNINERLLDLDLKLLELSNKIKSYHNELLALERQIKIIGSAKANYLTLLEAEKKKFFMGESSIFLINSREAAYVQAAIKLIELNVKYQQSLAEFRSASAIW